MTGIKHHVQSSTPNDPASEVSSNAWNEAHDKGATADVLTDHDKTLHDALGLNAATLENHNAAYFAVEGHTHNPVVGDATTLDGHDSTYFATADHTHNTFVVFAATRSLNFLRI